ncbi:PREDICTED: uncharacterized protein LOC104826491 [Tarenaya hassleriana]|uniref:uncharacterized protein LOC104826491 n=1 Tax=Tarenaya hassleriana TaxID=28532 RepID=UPI00053C4876|nr:PREDICTED: uncharacterized protein LOC104826491 [Tarenaya hassleriana]
MQPIRSISLPSRIHPPSVKLESAIDQLNLWQNSTTSSTSLQHGMLTLAELYNSIHDLLQSPLPTNRTLAHLAEDSLHVSATLLDSCDSSRNILLTLREHVLTLQSSFRRKGPSDSAEEVNNYFSFRRKAKKQMIKLLLGLKKLETKPFFSDAILQNADLHLQMLVSVLRTATAFAISVFRSLFLFLSSPAIKTKTCGLSIIPKLIPSRHLNSLSPEPMNEVHNTDVLLSSTRGSWNVKKTLERVDESIQGLETGLDSIFKCLVQNRVSFLNILTNNG